MSIVGDFVDAEREQVKGQVAIIGPSGSGKTVGALKIAYGLTGDWGKIGIIDTEHDRSKVYVGTTHTGLKIGKFKHLRLEPPYSHNKFEAAIQKAIAAGLDTVIVDSFSHEWEGTGGITDWANELGGEFRHWKQPKTAHKNLVDYMMHAPINIIVTIRTKQEYVVVPGGGNNGKSSVEKLGMKPVQSGDIDYEFLVAFTVDMDNTSIATKDNTGLYKGMHDIITEDHGRMLKEWLVEGKEVESVEEQKAKEEEARQVLIAKFTKQRKSNAKFESFYTTQEIKKNNIKIENWPLAALESLDKVLEEKRAAAEAKKAAAAAKAPEEQQEAPAEEEAPAADNTGMDRTAAILEIETLCKEDAKVKKAKDSFMKKHKIGSVENLKDDKLVFLLDLVRIKAKSAEKEAVTS